MQDKVTAYKDRVKRMSRKQVEATLAQHNNLVGTARWSALGEGLRCDLEGMAAVLREALE